MRKSSPTQTKARARRAMARPAGPATVAQRLQRQIGNRGTQHLLQAMMSLGTGIQRQEMEKEEQLQGKSASVQRQSPEEEKEVAPEVEAAINSKRGGGQPLDSGTRTQMGAAFRADFSGVRVHTDSQADRLNRELDSLAFTTASDVFFRSGEYRPSATTGRALLAHELTHVLQQRGGIQAKMIPGRPDDPLEREANRVAQQVVRSSGDFARSDDAVSQKSVQGEMAELRARSGIKGDADIKRRTSSSSVVQHLQFIRQGTLQHRDLYRQVIAQFVGREPRSDILAKQSRVLGLTGRRDRSATLRRCIPGCSKTPQPQRTFNRGETLAVDTKNKDGWIRALKGSEETSLPDYLKVEYQERKDGRDHFTIKEGPHKGANASLIPGYLEPGLSWEGAASVVFREDRARSTPLQSEGTLETGGISAPAKIYVPGDRSKIAANRAYPLLLPDHPHAGGARYGDFARVWFRIDGGPQGDEYLHRGDRSSGCISVASKWPEIYHHLIKCRSDDRSIGVVQREVP